MKVLKLGWEFPPYSWGGLGTACHGLVDGLSSKNIEINLVLPYKKECSIKNCNIISAISSKEIRSKSIIFKRLYGNIFEKVMSYEKSCKKILSNSNFDIIHAHDWLTYRAGIALKKKFKKPLVVHVHSIEFDRSDSKNINKKICNIEKKGMQFADKVLAVSLYTKKRIIKYYGISKDKIEVVHNAISIKKKKLASKPFGNKVFKVLFLGRLTYQKGPEYFISLAKKILAKNKNFEFIIAGDGDLRLKLQRKVKSIGLEEKIKFAGFLRGKSIDKLYQQADVYVMPSVCEPFGITPLEAMKNGCPVVISKNAGVCEVINNCFRVNPKDIRQMSESIMHLYKFKDLRKKIREKVFEEVKSISWNKSAERCLSVYKQLVLE